MSFHIDCAERACRTQVFTCAAADAAFGIDNGYFGGLRISGVRSHHLYGADRAVAGAVAALHLIGDADAILLYPYGMTYLDGRFVGFRYRPDSTCRTNFRTLGTFGTAVAALVGHFRLHQPCQVGRGAQHLVGTHRNSCAFRAAVVANTAVAERNARRVSSAGPVEVVVH